MGVSRFKGVDPVGMVTLTNRLGSRHRTAVIESDSEAAAVVQAGLNELELIAMQERWVVLRVCMRGAAL